jgi:hypothetical protein
MYSCLLMQLFHQRFQAVGQRGRLRQVRLVTVCLVWLPPAAT